MTRLDSALTPGGLQRRNAIINAAAQLFNEHGYHSTSTAQIADRVGCAKATVYHYFKKKPEILFEIHDQWIDELQSRVDERDPDLPAGEFLRGVVRDILSLMESKSDNVRVFFEYYRELPSDLRATATAKRDRYEHLVLQRIERGVAAGELQTSHPRIATFALFGMCNWAYQWYRRDGALNYEEVADELFSIYFGGLGSPGASL